MSKSYDGDFSSYRLYHADGAGHTLVSRSEGNRLVRRKLAQEGIDVDGVTPCFLSLKSSVARAARRRTLPAETNSSDETCRTFARNEVLAIAGRHFKHGRSRTARMSEAQRAERAARIYEKSMEQTGVGIKVHPEDLVERASNKFDNFRFVHLADHAPKSRKQDAWKRIAKLVSDEKKAVA